MLGKSATPNLNLSQVSEMMEKLFKLTPTKLHTLPSYDDQNFYVATSEGKEYVLKILNSEDSQNPTMFEVQTYAMSFLHQKGLPAQTALPNISGELMSLEEIGTVTVLLLKNTLFMNKHVWHCMFILFVQYLSMWKQVLL